MYSPLQIEIIKLLGSKELSEGCILQDTLDASLVKYVFDDDEGFPIILQLEGIYKGQYDDIAIQDLSDIDEWEILGHLPALEDLFIKVEEKGFTCLMRYNYLKGEYVGLEFDNTFGEDDVYALIPYNPKLKPYQQTEEVMQKILNLFK